LGGVGNLEQALRLRMLTLSGESPILRDYGLPLLIGQRTGSEMLGYISAHIRAQIEADERIEELTSIELTDTGDGARVYLEARASGSGLVMIDTPIGEV
jgi:hypothetical protein